MTMQPNTSDNPFGAQFIEDPYPFYRMGRTMSPVFFLPQASVWNTFTFDFAMSVLRDPLSWSSAPPESPAEAGLPEPSMLFSDPPRHTRLRGLVSQAFTPRMVEQLEPRIRAIAAELVGPALDAGKCDLVETLAYPLPVIVIAEILGVPPEDRSQFKAWSNQVVQLLGQGRNPDPSEIEGPLQAMREMREYFQRMADDRRVAPKSDLISRLVAVEMEGSKLSGEELLSMLVLLLVAGNETTTNLIGNAVLEFIAHPEQLAQIRANPALIPNAVEEVLRFSSPVQATARRATRDMQLGGQTIPAGEQLVVWLASANRDEKVFERADEFDVTRDPAPRHLAFGNGPHFCLGAPLARLEARVALETFLLQTDALCRTTEGPLPRVPTFVMRGVRELPVAFTR